MATRPNENIVHISTTTKPIHESPRKSWLSARTTLWYMSFCGFAINYVLRNNLNIAIVGMIKTGNIGANNKSTAHSTTGSECYNNTVLLYTTNLTHHEHLNHSVVADEKLLKTSGYLFEQLFLDLINVSAINIIFIYHKCYIRTQHIRLWFGSRLKWLHPLRILSYINLKKLPIGCGTSIYLIIFHIKVKNLA